MKAFDPTAMAGFDASQVAALDPTAMAGLIRGGCARSDSSRWSEC